MTHVENPGFIDSIGQDRTTISGWIGAAEDTQPPSVKAFCGSEFMGVARLGAPRPDVTRVTGKPNLTFTLKLSRPIKAVEVVGGAFHVVVAKAESVTTIPLSNTERKNEIQGALNELARQVTDPVGLIANLDRDSNADKKFAAEAGRKGAAGDLSLLPFPVGLRSRDHSAQVGREGHLFLTGGSNDLRARYVPPQTTKDKSQLDDDAAAWISLARQRYQRMSRMGIVFTQIIIPEKLTVLRDLAPLHIAAPTPLLSMIEEELSEEPFWVSGLEIFENWDNTIPPWQRNDSHCSPAGSLAIARKLINNMLGYEAPFLKHVPLTQSVYRDGDLTDRFFGTPIWDEHLEPAFEVLEASSESIENVLAVNPAKGVMGTHMVWRNSNAPIQKKVVVFGNSYFGSSAAEPAKLGWWFTRIFAEYHLVALQE
ncbi:hypothetical protein ACTXJR_07285 [Glutamicibacter ardleyensis]|uniref:hypothetical protein n=1 Tax=Glutamicibacter ardleyensis TaxID=225894 RepID=UPI003FCF95B7